ncbi:MAG: hypothetical protein M1816_005743 [Peltula sp. TS41687]|nr:MAG: hypothetical protein M1816_005743 [Peltula sp. TS41687]
MHEPTSSQTRHPLRIAVLKCDSPIPSICAKYGDYGSIFTNLLQTAADSLEQGSAPFPPDFSSRDLDITAWEVAEAQSYPRLEDVDAVLITGSRHCAFDNDPWILRLVAFTKNILSDPRSRVRVIGVCFGHQIIARALGAPVTRSAIGWELAVVPVTLTARGKELFGKTELNMHQLHRDIVTALPDGVESLGSTSICRFHVMYAAQRLISVQGHPEFNEDIETDILHSRHLQGIFQDEVFEDGMKRVGTPHDGVLVAQAFLRFCFG